MHVNQPGAGAMVAIVAKADLSVLEGRVDARRRRDEPRANPVTSAVGTVVAVFETPCFRKRFDRVDHAPQSVLIAKGHLLAIGVAVALNIWQTVRTSGVRPPVTAITDVIVRITRGRGTHFVNDGDDGKLEGFV